MGKYDWGSMKAGLQKGVGEKSDKKDYNDPREWKLTVDENQNGTAVIRLLPGKGGTTPPIVRIFEHSVRIFNKKSNKYRYFINPSPASIQEDCPASKLWYELGDIGTDEAKALQKEVSRSTKFISNILVINDPGNPENNGKVFYWKYGVKMFEKFQKALEPTEAQLKVGKKGVELFDPMLGADIVIDAQKVAGFRNYDGSTIEAPSAAFATEAEADEVVDEKCFDLTEFISPDHYEPYEKLLKNLRWTLAGSPIEALAILSGSEVITEEYKERGNTSGANAKADSATPSAGTASKPKVEPTPELETTPQPQVEKPKPKPKPVASDDDVLAMLDDL